MYIFVNDWTSKKINSKRKCVPVKTGLDYREGKNVWIFVLDSVEFIGFFCIVPYASTI